MAYESNAIDSETIEQARVVARALNSLLAGTQAPSRLDVASLAKRLLALNGSASAGPLPSLTEAHLAPGGARKDQLCWVDGLEGLVAMGPLEAPDGPVQQVPVLRDARDAFERAYLRAVLRRTRGNVTAAAKLAGRNRTDFYELLHRRRVSPREFKG